MYLGINFMRSAKNIDQEVLQFNFLFGLHHFRLIYRVNHTPTGYTLFAVFLGLLDLSYEDFS